ncbi:MAG: hypothetical protein L3J41_08590 [Melioribacteraceae bacterium]|nr:hypothetical protein [Melioribacteraceae bacterium]
MRNKINCENCNSDNDFYNLNCKSCGALQRDKFPNIDLFSTIWHLIETPTNTLKKIIYAEHKNYLTFLLVLLILKLLFTSFFLQSAFCKPVDYQNYLSVNYGIGFAGFIILILLYPLIIKLILINYSVSTCYKDNLALLVYSQTPLILFLILILPIEFAIFGKYWLFSNPSPFMIKEIAAYAFSFMEMLAFIGSILLFGIALKIQSNSKVFSIIFTLLYLFILFGFFFFIPYFV